MGLADDPEDRVIGTSTLHVVDSLILPHMTNGNLNAPSIMVAEKIGNNILGRTPLPVANDRPWIHLH